MNNPTRRPPLNERAVQHVLDRTAGETSSNDPTIPTKSLRRVEETLAFLHTVPAERPRPDLPDQVLSRIQQQQSPAERSRSVTCGALRCALAAGLVIGLTAFLHITIYRPDSEPLASASSRTAQNWLLAVQEPEGHWDATRWGGHPHFDIALTALSTLALLDTPHPSEDVMSAIRRAAIYLAAQQEHDGRFGSARHPGNQNHVLATLALQTVAEQLDDPTWDRAIRAALNFSAQEWDPGESWAYGAQNESLSTVSGHLAQASWQSIAASRMPSSGTAEEAWLRVGGPIYGAALTLMQL